MSSEGELFIDGLFDENESRERLQKEIIDKSKIWEEKFGIKIDVEDFWVDKSKYYDIWNMGNVEADTLPILSQDLEQEYKIGEISFDVEYEYERNEYGNLMVSQVYPKHIEIRVLDKPEKWNE